MKAYHTAIVGDSGGGKTTLMRELYHDPGWKCRSVWVNHNDESGLTGHGGRDAETVDGERALRRSTAGSVNYVVSSQVNGTETAVEYAAEYYNTHGVPVQVFVDEVHDVWPDKGDKAKDNAVKWALQEGRDNGVVLRFATQDPSDMKPYTPLKQIRYLAWCGEAHGFHDGFLNAHQWIPRGELPEEPYEYVVLDKQGNVVYRGETNPTYG